MKQSTNKKIENICNNIIKWQDWIVSIYISIIASIVVTLSVSTQFVWTPFVYIFVIILLLLGLKYTLKIHRRFDEYRNEYICLPDNKKAEKNLLSYCENKENIVYKECKKKYNPVSEYRIMIWSLIVSVVIFFAIGLSEHIFGNTKVNEPIQCRNSQVDNDKLYYQIDSLSREIERLERVVNECTYNNINIVPSGL